MKDIKTLTDQVRQTAYDIHVYHADGLLINFGSYKLEIRKFAWSASVQSQRRSGFFSFISALCAFFAV